MERETYAKQKIFAGEKRESMNRRLQDHDYTDRMMYMVTMVVEGRRELFGRVLGRSDAPEGSNDAPRIQLSELGSRVSDEWWGIPRYYPQVEIIALQLMPDHLHGILFVKEKMHCDLSRVIRGFKTGCNRAYRQLFPAVAPPVPSVAPPVPSVATQSQPTAPRPKDDRIHGLLFARGFNDKVLLRRGQLERWINYLHDNPRRLLLRREHPDFFRVQRGIALGPYTFSAIGNRFLLQRPVCLQVQCSRHLYQPEIDALCQRYLEAARQGAVLVSPCISEGEKQIMRAAFEEGHPEIILLKEGFSDMAKPGGRRIDACARGQLLLLAPWEHHNERLPLTRSECLQLNAMAEHICQGRRLE